MKGDGCNSVASVCLHVADPKSDISRESYERLLFKTIVNHCITGLDGLVLSLTQ